MLFLICNACVGCKPANQIKLISYMYSSAVKTEDLSGCSRLPASGASQYYASFLFFLIFFFFVNVLRKSYGEITQARSPPFTTDGKPFQRD